jgi:2-dehydropantoate 2-reductase
MSEMKVLIIGAGAMGCRFGMHYQMGGADVVLCDVWKEHVDAINRDGLRVVTDGKAEYVKLHAVTEVKDAGNFDVAMIFTKSMQTEAAIQSALTVMGADTPVMTLQNGLGNLELIEKHIDNDRIIMGCTKTATGLAGPGVITVEGFAESDIMALGDRAEKMALASKEALETGGMPCHISKNIMNEIWQKLAFNSAMNSITAITRQFPGYIGEHGVELFEKIVHEVKAVAVSEGIAVDADALMDTVYFLTGPNGDKQHFTSMVQDVLNEKQTEADFICGPIIRRAAAKGIAVPHLQTVYNLIKIIDSNYKNQAKLMRS